MLLAALALGASFTYENLFFLPWICFLPFLLSLQGVTIKRAYFLGLGFGCLFFVIASHWIVGFLQKMSNIGLGYAISLAGIYWIFCAQQFALLAAAVVWVAKKQPGSEWLSLPLFSCLLFYALPLIFPSDLSVTQSKFLLALQAVDTTGALGLHFIILLHNGLLFAVVKNSFRQLNNHHYAAVGLICAWFIYGCAAYFYWVKQEQNWPRLNVGVVQPNIAASIGVPAPPQGFSRAYPVEMDLSVALARAGASLIVWPEARYRGFYNEAYVRDAFKYYADKTDASLLIQDLQTKDNLTFNTSALITKKNRQDYAKQIRIPFGEYLPGESVPLLGIFFKKIFGDFYTPIAAGSISEPMEFRKIKIQPLICFEIADANYLANLVRSSTQQKKPIQLLLVQSNDSWFDTDIEPRLHLATSQLRSIEQRLPLVHALNNGPSSFYKASGQVDARLAANERSAAVRNITYPESVAMTVYARYPHLFIVVILLCSICWLLRALILNENRKSFL